MALQETYSTVSGGMPFKVTGSGSYSIGAPLYNPGKYILDSEKIENGGRGGIDLTGVDMGAAMNRYQNALAEFAKSGKKLAPGDMTRMYADALRWKPPAATPTTPSVTEIPGQKAAATTYPMPTVPQVTPQTTSTTAPTNSAVSDYWSKLMADFTKSQQDFAQMMTGIMQPKASTLTQPPAQTAQKTAATTPASSIASLAALGANVAPVTVAKSSLASAFTAPAAVAPQAVQSPAAPQMDRAAQSAYPTAQAVNPGIQKVLDAYGGQSAVEKQKQGITGAQKTMDAAYDAYKIQTGEGGKIATDYYNQAIEAEKASQAARTKQLQEAAAAAQQKIAQAAANATQALSGSTLKASQTLAEAQRRAQEALLSGKQEAIAMTQKYLADAIAAANYAYERDKALVQESIDKDRATLEAYLLQALQSQEPYIQASQMQLSVLPRLLQAMGIQQGEGLPTSLGAQLAMQDASRQIGNTMQRQGLAGSLMQGGATAAARARILAADQEAQINRAQNMVNSGMAESGKEAAILGQYAPTLGTLNARMATLRSPDLSNLYSNAGTSLAGIANNYGSNLANLTQNYGTNIANLQSGQGQAIANLYTNTANSGANLDMQLAQGLASIPNNLPSMYATMGSNLGALQNQMGAIDLQKALSQANTQAQLAGMQAPSPMSQVGEYLAMVQAARAAGVDLQQLFPGMAPAVQPVSYSRPDLASNWRPFVSGQTAMVGGFR